MACFTQCLRSTRKKSSAVPEHPLSVEVDRPSIYDRIDLSGVYLKPADRVLKFSFEELKVATDDFHSDRLLGEGSLGKVYKGNVEGFKKVVAIKQLDHKSNQSTYEFAAEVMTVAAVCHPNLIYLIGYCAEGDRRLLVYEFFPLHSLKDHLHGLHVLPDGKPLDWNRRMYIATSAAKALSFMHGICKPPVIHKNLKSTNVMLEELDGASLSDFGFCGDGPSGDETHVTKVTGTLGYLAPEYAGTGRLTIQTDIFSFGVVLLELITARKAFDETREEGQQSLAEWVWHLLSVSKGRGHFQQFADPNLQGRFPEKAWRMVLGIGAWCVHKNPDKRPTTSRLLGLLCSAASIKYVPTIPAASSEASSSREKGSSDAGTTPREY